MDVLCITGAAPGPVSATISHNGAVRQLRLDVAAHPAGGWQARRPGAAWGPRCHSVHTAVLLEGADAFDEMPMALAAD
jgi:hypothetical protein